MVNGRYLRYFGSCWRGIAAYKRGAAQRQSSWEDRLAKTADPQLEGAPECPWYKELDEKEVCGLERELPDREEEE